MTNTAITTSADIAQTTLNEIKQEVSLGLTMPVGYNYVNAIRAAMLCLADLKTKDGRSVFDACTPVSIQNALMKMATKGLDVSKKTCYFIIRGNQLCCDDSYFGKVLQVKRVFPDWEPQPRVIYEGDVVKYHTDPETGYRVLDEHQQAFENLDKGLVGAYMYLPRKNGKDLYMMTKNQIVRAWMKSTNKSLSTHKEFMEKMASKTIINSGLNMIINSTPELAHLDADDYVEQTEEAPEVKDVEIADIPLSEPTKIYVNDEPTPIKTLPTTEAQAINFDEDFK